MDRHDLVGFRVAAVSAPPASSGAEIEPRAAVIVDDRPWSERPLDLAWYWVPTGDDDAVRAIDPLTEAAGAGPIPTLTVPASDRRLVLVARRDGDERRAFLDLPEEATLPALGGIDLASLPLRLEGLEGPELSLAARRELTPTPAPVVPVGGLARLTLRTGEGPEPVVRWMATAGTFLELERTVTDWAPAELRLDEDELEEPPEPLPPGAVTVVALALGEVGEAAFVAADLHVGEPGPGLWVAGRWLPTDGPVSHAAGEGVRGTLEADDDSPVGLVLRGGRAEAVGPATDWGTPALGCLVSRDGPFDPEWMLTQICGRDGVIGREVVVLPEDR